MAVEPARVPYGAYLRLPASVADGVAATQARRLKLPGVPRAIVIFHPLQYPLARGLIVQHPDAELWYWRWDRYEVAYDASARQRARLEELHLAASLRAAVTVVVSEALGELAREEGSEPLLVPLAADSFPAPAPGETVVAVSLGHLGHRTDWKLLREVCERMPELILLLIGAWHEQESGRDPDFQALRGAANVVWLGRRSDEEAARLILLADVGIVPFERSEFNDTALPYRILKYARLGRRTVSPDLKGVRTWDRAVTIASTPEAVGRGAARAGRGADASGHRVAGVGAGPDRPRAESAALGADGDVGYREWALGLGAAQQRLNALRRPCLASGVNASPGRLTLGEVPAAKP